MQRGNTDRLILTSNELTQACTDMHGSVCVATRISLDCKTAFQYFSFTVLHMQYIYFILLLLTCRCFFQQFTKRKQNMTNHYCSCCCTNKLKMHKLKIKQCSLMTVQQTVQTILQFACDNYAHFVAFVTLCRNCLLSSLR